MSKDLKDHTLKEGNHTDSKGLYSTVAGTPAIVEVEDGRYPYHITIGAIHSSTTSEESKERKFIRDKDQKADEIIIEEPVKNTSMLGTLMNEQLDIMDMGESVKGSRLVIDNCTLHKSHPMIRKIESRGHGVMYMSPYSPELDPIEQIWAFVKRKRKCEDLS
ncbi:hypothetical protein PHYBLDRAFT_143486 [Phycomyces blakesleeanus NRRL 1555(-)]|uniref:Tc1-like transposase DDE domain-containing protein n=1 Tax=Phycomyces blakesleeanus (strain ATCC 8743b / DSM 1359 / FGSC 10004 / NBRC 33097 / NRRL 1555) TaxID=763407 RepID=A0A162PXU9_PHYB8|nr:hypothetical protein PHYBLDRAFT_143486 [Phycomyces blakesleeanus NRRL 1555(-)]OAD75226.1 hypothetical protein PHYBLDRAFT_143486 [Phycomyces blakesleeanus NRRL 1555(-)]|eukprot:XP_018293266.1 hypothetical protein PHYBLDRAFT_143486 [Phycomyces blakesleeanus NRRL 1555(-)]